MGLVCAILAPAGPQKSRIISIFHKDVRTQKIEHYDILEKMFLGRVIKRPDVK
jgi:COP9 signalosome complex subunit 4